MTGLIAFYMHDLSGGGVERMRLCLIAELRARGVRVCLIVGRARGALSGLVPVDLDMVELGQQGMLPSVWPLARVLRRLRPEYLVASLDHNNVTALLAGWGARTGTRVIVCQHNALSAERDAGWKYRAVPWLYWMLQARAHGFVAVSHGVADDLARVAGIARARITPVYNPVIGSDFEHRANGPVPHAWLEDSGAPVCIFAGRLTEQKDPGLALRSVALLASRLPVRLILLGEGPLLDSLRAEATSLGITDLVHFAGFQANPLPWIARSACLVSTSRYEGLGNVLIEALALGTQVVATDCPFGPSEILLGGEVGELVPVGDAPALADAIARTVSRQPDRALLKARAARFSASACANAHVRLFETSDAPRPAHRPFGLSFSPLSAGQVVERLMAPATESVRLVVTPNIDHVRLLRGLAFRQAYRSAALVCPDGLPVLAYARLRGLKVRARVTGCEIFACLARHPRFSEKSVLIVAESESTLSAVQNWAAQRGLNRLHVMTAPARLGADPAGQARLAHAIRQLAPDILVMTLGAPVSELFVHVHRGTLPPCWAVCIGQAVRAELQLVERAPALWQRLGLEWLWRIRQEPRRLVGRYARAAAWFPVAVLADLAGGQSRA